MAEKKKVQYIQTSEHSMIGGSDALAPGDRVLLDEDNDSHKHLVKLIEAQDPSVSHLQLIEVDPSAEAKAEEEKAEMLAKAAEIAAEARAEQARELTERLEENEELQAKAQEEGQPTATSGTDFPPQDEEAISLAKQSGAGQRASTQEDVADEDQPKQGRRTSKRGG